jgi:hypothetical protein
LLADTPSFYPEYGQSMNQKPVLIPLGGFLGAGKTTLILTAARILQARGLRVAAILNDQGSELVDTQHVRGSGVDADQVTGGCFCCRFSELVEATERISAFAPVVIFAEAVGSCTDISATTLRPLQLDYAHLVDTAPFSVLVDPQRARDLTAQDADPDLAFLFQKQIEEADLVCFTKSDLHTDVSDKGFPQITGATVRYLSPLTGEGVEAWLDEVLSGKVEPGTKILDIDYQRYGRAEASLAWLNCSLLVHLTPPLSPASLVGPFLDELDAGLTAAGMRIVHLKLIDHSPSGYLKASITRDGAEPEIVGMLDASPAAAHELLLNVRATGQPHVLQSVVESQIAKMPGKVEIRTMQCFSPAAPRPERRYA